MVEFVNDPTKEEINLMVFRTSDSEIEIGYSCEDGDNAIYIRTTNQTTSHCMGFYPHEANRVIYGLQQCLDKITEIKLQK